MNQNGGAEDCCFIRFCLSNRPTLKGCRGAYAGHGSCHSKGFGFWPTPQLLEMQPITKTLPIKFPKTNRRHRTIRHNHDTPPNPSNPITCRGSLTEQNDLTNPCLWTSAHKLFSFLSLRRFNPRHITSPRFPWSIATNGTFLTFYSTIAILNNQRNGNHSGGDAVFPNASMTSNGWFPWWCRQTDQWTIQPLNVRQNTGRPYLRFVCGLFCFWKLVDARSASLNPFCFAADFFLISTSKLGRNHSQWEDRYS